MKQHDNVVTLPTSTTVFPIPAVAALTPTASSDSPLHSASTPTILNHAFTSWPLHIATPPTVEFLLDEHPANFASPNTLNNVVQFGPMIFAGYSWMLVCVAGYSFESSGISAAWWGYLPHQFLHRARKVWPIHGKDFVTGTDTLEHLQVFLDEEILLLFNLLRRLVPLCRPAQLADIACLGTSRVVCSCFGNTSGTCQSQCLQCAENMLPAIHHFCIVSVLSKKLTARDLLWPPKGDNPA